MYKSIYISENATKNLLRTPGVLGTSFLVALLGIIFFTAWDAYFITCHWYYEVLSQEVKNTSMGLLQAFSPTILLIRIIKIFLGIILISLFFSLISYVRRTFFQFAVIQRLDFQIMSLVGETTNLISLGFALQPILLLVTVLSITSIGVNLLFQLFLASYLTVFNMYSLQLLPIFFCCIVVALRTFFYVRRYLFSIFDNLQKV